MAANTTIDELILDIIVKDENSGKKVSALANALDRLNKVVDNLNLDKIADVFSNLTTSITPFTNKIASVKTELNALNRVLLKSGSFKKIAEDVKKPTKELNAFSKTVEKSTKKVSHHFAAFKRIAFYRFARMIIKEIASAFRDGVSGLSEFNNSFKQTMDSLTTSANKVKLSLTAGLYQILIILEPLIEKLANQIVLFANKLSLALAVWRDTGKYTKVNTKYIQEYNKALKGTLLSFDTFETLGKKEGIDFSKAFEEVNISDVTEKELKAAKPLVEIFETLEIVWESLKKVWISLEPVLSKIWKIFVKIITSDAVAFVVDLVAGFLDFLVANELLEPLLWGIVAVLGVIALLNPFVYITAGIIFLSVLIKEFIENIKDYWDILKKFVRDIGNFFANIGITIAKLFIQLVNLVIDFINILIKPLDWIAQIFGKRIQIPKWDAKVSYNPIPEFKDGGTFGSADLFYANEDGRTELIASNNSGGGAVMNLSQWAEVSEKSFLNALYKYGAAQNGALGNLSFNLDGAEVARSKRFVNETNARNPGLNLV